MECPKCGYKEPGKKEKENIFNTYMSSVLEKTRNKLKQEMGYGLPNKEK